MPCTYMVCEKDNAVPVKRQEMMLENVRKDCRERGVGTEWLSVVRVACGHSPWLSQVEKVVELVREVAGQLNGAGDAGI